MIPNQYLYHEFSEKDEVEPLETPLSGASLGQIVAEGGNIGLDVEIL